MNSDDASTEQSEIFEKGGSSMGMMVWFVRQDRQNTRGVVASVVLHLLCVRLLEKWMVGHQHHRGVFL